VSPFAVDQQEQLRRQRIVTHCLRPHLSPAELTAALKVWEKDYGHNRDFAWAQYLGVVETNLDDERKLAIRILFQENMFKSLQDLGQEPPEHFSDKSIGAKDTPFATSDLEKLAAALAGFNAIIGGVVEQVSRQKGGAVGRLRSSLKVNLPSLLGGAQKARQISEWCDTWGHGRPVPCKTSIVISEMSTIIHSIYTWSCEEYGPVATDRLFGQVIREAENISESSTFSPRKLL